MGNSHGRHRSESLATKPAHKLQPPAAQPRAHQNIQKEASATPNKKDNAQQQQKTNSEGSKKGRKKKSKHTSDQPRKGRKESFSKYIPGYVPTNPLDEELGGLFDAVAYDDPYTIAREKLQNPSKPATQLHQVRNTPHRGQPRVVPAQPSYQSAHCTCGYSAHPDTNQYYGANANDCLYLDSMYNDNHDSGEYASRHNAGDSTSHNDGSSAHHHDTASGYGAPPDQIGHHAGGNTDGYGHNDHHYDGGTADTAGVHDAAGSYDFGSHSGGGYDCGGSGDTGGS